MVKYSPKEHALGTIMADVISATEAGETRYFFDAVDVATKFGFSYYFNKQTSQNMVNFYEMFKKVFPFKIKKWQNHNGHENLGLFQLNYKMANMCLTNTLSCKKHM